MPVGVLQPFTGQRGAPRGRAERETACHLVGRGPESVTGALEPEHRIEDVDRDHRLVVCRVRRTPGGERRGGPGRGGAKDAVGPASLMPSCRIWPTSLSLYANIMSASTAVYSWPLRL